MRRALAGLLAGCAALLLLLRHAASPAWTPIRVTSATSGVRAANYSSLRAHIAQHVRIHQRATQSRANATARSEDSAAPTADSVPACQITREAGFNGGALTWGMTFKVETAGECCDACRAHHRICGPGKTGSVFWRRTWEGKAHEERCTKVMWEELEVACNTWVYCSYPLCWSNDVWNHSRGECWLKHQNDPTRPNAGSYGAYPEGYRKKHHTAPERVQWMSGVLTTGHVVVDGPHWHW